MTGLTGSIYDSAEAAVAAADAENTVDRELDYVHMWITEAANAGQYSMYYNTVLSDDAVQALIDEGFNVIFNLNAPNHLPMVISWKADE